MLTVASTTLLQAYEFKILSFIRNEFDKFNNARAVKHCPMLYDCVSTNDWKQFCSLC